MKSNFFVFVLIAIIATLVGVGVSVKLTSDPVLASIVGLQQEILALQKKIDRQTVTTDKILGERIAALEKKLDQMKIDQLAAAVPKPPVPQRVMPPQEDPNKIYDIPVGASMIRGKAKAKVTIVGFLDLQCPYCGRFQPVIDQVLAAYPNDVNYVVKAFPLSFHPQAKPAAKAVLAAGEQGKYWEMLELIFKSNRDLSEAKYLELAKSLKLNMKKFEADYKGKDTQWEQMIQADYDLGLKSNVPGTPTYYINGHKSTARDLDSFKKEIDAILKK